MGAGGLAVLLPQAEASRKIGGGYGCSGGGGNYVTITRFADLKSRSESAALVVLVVVVILT